jgi:hypothetical protein
MEVVLIELAVALLTVALDIGLAALDRAPVRLEMCSWGSIAAIIISSESSSDSSSDEDSITFL